MNESKQEIIQIVLMSARDVCLARNISASDSSGTEHLIDCAIADAFRDFADALALRLQSEDEE